MDASLFHQYHGSVRQRCFGTGFRFKMWRLGFLWTGPTSGTFRTSFRRRPKVRYVRDIIRPAIPARSATLKLLFFQIRLESESRLQLHRLGGTNVRLDSDPGLREQQPHLRKHRKSVQESLERRNERGQFFPSDPLIRRRRSYLGPSCPDPGDWRLPKCGPFHRGENYGVNNLINTFYSNINISIAEWIWQKNSQN